MGPTTNSPSNAAGTAAVSVSGVEKSFGETPVLAGVSFVVAPGELVALLGPSGCGKSTLLRVIAGLETLDSGRVSIGGTVVAGAGDGAAVSLAPERRGVGLVFQNGALFPHLNVADNIAYGLGPKRRVPKEQSAQRVSELLEMVGLSGFEQRHPDQLSGGQQQRVALARALAPQPSVMLLDEPFSNLDARLRRSLRIEVAEVLREAGTPAVLVTHDRDEAFAFADRVAVMNDGVIRQIAPSQEVYERPRDAWVAAFVGDVNVLEVRRGGVTQAETALGAVRVAEAVDAGDVVMIRPEHVTFERAATWPLGVVVGIEYAGSVGLIEVDADGVRLRSEQPWQTASSLTIGTEVIAKVAPGVAAHRLS